MSKMRVRLEGEPGNWWLVDEADVGVYRNTHRAAAIEHANANDWKITNLDETPGPRRVSPEASDRALRLRQEGW